MNTFCICYLFLCCRGVMHQRSAYLVVDHFLQRRPTQLLRAVVKVEKVWWQRLSLGFVLRVVIGFKVRVFECFLYGHTFAR